MRYKTLFRIGLKLIGVWMLAQAIGSLAGDIVHAAALNQQYSSSDWWTRWWASPFLDALSAPLARNLVMLAVGLYLFFGGRWIVNRAVPSNRPYFPECGYDLSHRSGDICPECGSPVETTGSRT